MDNLTPNQNLEGNAQPAEAENNVDNIGASFPLGKFKSVEALYSAYSALEAQFTRRSQRLKELEDEVVRLSCDNQKSLESAPSADNGITNPPQEEALSKERITELALSDEDIKRAVIEAYVKGISRGAVPLIVNGGTAVPTQRSVPSSIREAGALAKQFLKKENN